MNGIAVKNIKDIFEELKVPFICSLAINLLIVIIVPYFTFIRPKKSNKVYKVDFFRVPPPQKKKKEIIKKKEKPPPKLPEDTENVNKDALKPPPPEEQVYEMEDLDDIPRLKVMIKPKYPERLRLLGVEDRVIVKFMINYYGHVEKVEILDESEHEQFNASTLEAIRKWQFTPPKIDGKPANVKFVVPIKFELE